MDKQRKGIKSVQKYRREIERRIERIETERAELLKGRKDLEAELDYLESREVLGERWNEE